MKKNLRLCLASVLMLSSTAFMHAQTFITIPHAAQPPALVAIASGDVTICNGNNTVLNASQSGGTSTFSYLWSPGATLSSTTSATPTATPTISTPYTLTVTDSRNCSAQDVVNVTVIDCSGLEEIKEIEAMNIYPNPSEGDFNVSIQFKNKPSTVLLQIFNMNGELIVTKNYQKPGTELKESFSLTTAAAGNYLMRITVGTHSLTKTFIIK